MLVNSAAVALFLTVFIATVQANLSVIFGTPLGDHADAYSGPFRLPTQRSHRRNRKRPGSTNRRQKQHTKKEVSPLVDYFETVGKGSNNNVQYRRYGQPGFLVPGNAPGIAGQSLPTRQQNFGGFTEVSAPDFEAQDSRNRLNTPNTQTLPFNQRQLLSGGDSPQLPLTYANLQIPGTMRHDGHVQDNLFDNFGNIKDQKTSPPPRPSTPAVTTSAYSNEGSNNNDNGGDGGDDYYANYDDYDYNEGDYDDYYSAMYRERDYRQPANNRQWMMTTKRPTTRGPPPSSFGYHPYYGRQRPQQPGSPPRNLFGNILGGSLATTPAPMARGPLPYYRPFDSVLHHSNYGDDYGDYPHNILQHFYPPNYNSDGYPQRQQPQHQRHPQHPQHKPTHPYQQSLIGPNGRVIDASRRPLAFIDSKQNMDALGYPPPAQMPVHPQSPPRGHQFQDSLHHNHHHDRPSHRVVRLPLIPSTPRPTTPRPPPPTAPPPPPRTPPPPRVMTTPFAAPLIPFRPATQKPPVYQFSPEYWRQVQKNLEAFRNQGGKPLNIQQQGYLANNQAPTFELKPKPIRKPTILYGPPNQRNRIEPVRTHVDVVVMRQPGETTKDQVVNGYRPDILSYPALPHATANRLYRLPTPEWPNQQTKMEAERQTQYVIVRCGSVTVSDVACCGSKAYNYRTMVCSNGQVRSRAVTALATLPPQIYNWPSSGSVLNNNNNNNNNRRQQGHYSPDYSLPLVYSINNNNIAQMPPSHQRYPSNQLQPQQQQQQQQQQSLSICGKKTPIVYNPQERFCCGESLYDGQPGQICCNNAIYAYSPEGTAACCGQVPYDSITHTCLNSDMVVRKGRSTDKKEEKS